MEVHVGGAHWTQSGPAYVSGSAFLDGDLLDERALADRVAATEDADELARLLSRANGFFSLIHRRDDAISLAVDHVRSWPLFYAVTDDVYVSDSAEWVHETGARRGFDPVAGTEYLCTGFVPGRATLSRDVSQVRAGEIVTLAGDGASVSRDRYFNHRPDESSTPVDPEAFEAVLREAVGRLIEYADGRTVLLGLSDGYDSRLIALLLHQLGYDDVVAYTSQTADRRPEVLEVGESIARDLGFEHVRITTNDADYDHIDNSAEMDLVSDVGYLAEYPSVNKVVQRRKMAAAGIDPSEVVHVLGHQLLGAGTFLPDWIRERDVLDRETLGDLLWRLHYSHWELPGDSEWRRLLESRMLEHLPSGLYERGDVEPTPEAVSGFEQWYWQERLPKYIIIRQEYAHLGFDVWYPLLDRALFSFFEHSHHHDRVGKRILKETARRLDGEIRGTPSDLAPAGSSQSRSLREAAWDRLVDLVHALPDPASEYVRDRYYAYTERDVYDRDPRYNIVSEAEFDGMALPTGNEGDLHRTILLLYLYRQGYFEFPTETEFDRALADT